MATNFLLLQLLCYKFDVNTHPEQENIQPKIDKFRNVPFVGCKSPQQLLSICTVIFPKIEGNSLNNNFIAFFK